MLRAVRRRISAHFRAYLGALQSVPEIAIHYGNFLSTEKWAGIVHPPKTKPPVPFTPPFPDVIKVWKTEEKGSDVNLGCHLVRDAFQGSYDAAAVLSNDTDLVEPIRIVTQELGLPSGLSLLFPNRPPVSRPSSVSFATSGQAICTMRNFRTPFQAPEFASRQAGCSRAGRDASRV